MRLIPMFVVVLLLAAEKAQGWGGVHNRQWPWRDRQVPELMLLDIWHLPKIRVDFFFDYHA